jgi:hypothetical protein
MYFTPASPLSYCTNYHATAHDGRELGLWCVTTQSFGALVRHGVGIALLFAGILGACGDSAKSEGAETTGLDTAIDTSADDSGSSPEDDTDEVHDTEDTDDTEGLEDTGDSGTPLNTLDADNDGHTVADGDCDDGDALIHPDADEVCNEKDDDCDGVIDEDPVFAPSWYLDADGDGYGDRTASLQACSAPDGYVAGGATAGDFDCDDTEPMSHPTAEERCDGYDNDCDSEVDEDAVDLATWYADLDGDGYGNPDTVVHACAAADGHVADNTDCDDDAVTAHPGAVEYCDGLDNDCDDEIDTDAIFGTVSWYRDEDGDGHGDPDISVESCDGPIGSVRLGDDCDDANIDRSPSETEVCDGVDNNCDLRIDEDHVCL